MGYTHYWKLNKSTNIKAKDIESIYQKAIKECNNLIFKVYHGQVDGMDKISLSGYSAHVNGCYGGLMFNGARDDAHETFIFREHFKENDDFNFCKTAQKPYDIVIIACLTILSYRLGNLIEVSSDGNLDEWLDGIALAQKVTKLKIVKRIIKNKCIHPLNEVVEQLNIESNK